jgi:hypothetical protein
VQARQWLEALSKAASWLLYHESGHQTMNRYLSRRLLKRLKGTDGANLIEGAIITPILILLTFGIIEFSMVFFTYLALQNGVSQATRFGITGGVTGGMSRVDSIKNAMRQSTPTLTIPDSAFTFQHMSPGGSAWVGGTGAPGEVEKVTVVYTWNFFTPLMWPFFPTGGMTLRVDSIMKNESRFE